MGLKRQHMHKWNRVGKNIYNFILWNSQRASCVLKQNENTLGLNDFKQSQIGKPFIHGSSRMQNKEKQIV